MEIRYSKEYLAANTGFETAEKEPREVGPFSVSPDAPGTTASATSCRMAWRAYGAVMTGVISEDHFVPPKSEELLQQNLRHFSLQHYLNFGAKFHKDMKHLWKH